MNAPSQFIAHLERIAGEERYRLRIHRAETAVGVADEPDILRKANATCLKRTEHARSKPVVCDKIQGRELKISSSKALQHEVIAVMHNVLASVRSIVVHWNDRALHHDAYLLQRLRNKLLIQIESAA